MLNYVEGGWAMSEANTALVSLQKLADGFVLDAARVRGALEDKSVDSSGRRLLVGALQHVLDSFDMFPDHYWGFGYVDAAMVLRVAAAQTVANGATFRGLLLLSKETSEIERLLGSLYQPLWRMVKSFPDKTIRGRSVNQILEDKDARASFESDLNRALGRVESGAIEVSWMGPDGVVAELRRILKHALEKGGYLGAPQEADMRA